MTLEELADELEGLLGIIGYEVIDRVLEGANSIDLLAEIRVGELSRRMLVRVIDGVIGVPEVEALEEGVRGWGVSTGWAISEQPVPKAALEYAEKKKAVGVFDLNSFQVQYIAPYYDFLKW